MPSSVNIEKSKILNIILFFLTSVFVLTERKMIQQKSPPFPESFQFFSFHIAPNYRVRDCSDSFFVCAFDSAQDDKQKRFSGKPDPTFFSGGTPKSFYPINPFPIKYSAICMALVAAPFLKLSATHHMFRVLSCDSSLRIRPTKTSSFS
jgi:hypothetical protein